MTRAARASRQSGQYPVVAALAFLAALCGCTEVTAVTQPVHEPAKLQEAPAGSDNPLVVLERGAAGRISLETANVVKTGGTDRVPYAALIYDPSGACWVYVRTAPRTYLRTPVTLNRVEGDAAWLRDGPPPGAVVVTTGATELYGAELEIAGSH